jgi:hypothetical protein
MTTIDNIMDMLDNFEYAVLSSVRGGFSPEGLAQMKSDIRAAIEAKLKMEHLNYLGCMEDLKEAEKQTDHFRDATEKVDCPRCGHCCPDDTELRQLREQNLMLDAELAKDEALLRQALDALENHTAIKHPQQRYYREAAIAALRERLEHGKR